MIDSSLSVQVSVDQATAKKSVTFNRPITPVEASNYLFGNPNDSCLLKSFSAVGHGRSSCYIIDTKDIAAIMRLRPSNAVDLRFYRH